MASEVDMAKLENLFNKLDNIARLEERVDNLENWQDKQNGSLLRLEEKLNDFNKEISNDIKSLHLWLIGLLGSTIVTLIALILNLVKDKI